MAKKIQVVVDVNSSSVEIASDNTLTLTQQVRVLRQELQKVPEGTAEWTLIQQKYNETKDALDRVNVKSKELFGTMSALPGPIGQVSGQLDNTVGVLKTFSGIKLSDVKTQFVELGKDLKGIGVAFLDLTGITKLYDATTKGLTKTMVYLGIAEEGAALAAKGLSVALIASGIGAVVVTLGLLIANFDKLKDSFFNATEESKAFEESQSKVTDAVKDFNIKLIDVKNSLKAAKEGTKSKEAALKDYNEKLGETVGYAGSLEQAEALMAANTPTIIKSIKLRAEAQVMYAKAAEYSAKITSGETTEIGFWEGFYNYASSLGDWGGMAVKNAEDMANKVEVAQAAITKLQAKGDELTNQAIENDKLLKKGLAAPPDSKKKDAKEDPRVKERKEALELIAKYEEEGYVNSLDARNKELYAAGKAYNEALIAAKKQGVDLTVVQETYRKTEQAINKKYDDEEEKKKQERIDKEKEFWKKAKEAADEKRKKQFDDEVKALEDQTRLDEARLKTLQEGTVAYFDAQRKLEDDLYAEKIKKAKDNNTQIEAIETEHKQNLKNIDEAEFQAKKDLQLQIVNLYGGFGKALQEIAGKNKGLAIAGLIIEQAAGVAAIIINTQKAAAKAGYFTPLGIATLVAGTASVAAAVIATKKGIDQIKNTQIPGASGSGGGGSTPTPAFNGTVSVPAPVIGASSAQSSGNLGQVIGTTMEANNSRTRPIQAYVIGDQVSTQQQLDRRISVAAKMGG